MPAVSAYPSQGLEGIVNKQKGRRISDPVIRQALVALYNRKSSAEERLIKLKEAWLQFRQRFGRLDDILFYELKASQSKRVDAYFHGNSGPTYLRILDVSTGQQKGVFTTVDKLHDDFQIGPMFWESRELGELAYLLLGKIITTSYLSSMGIETDVTFDSRLRYMNVVKTKDGNVIITSYAGKKDPSERYVVIGRDTHNPSERKVIKYDNTNQLGIIVDRIKRSGFVKTVVDTEGEDSLHKMFEIKAATYFPFRHKFIRPALTSPFYS